jgi:hypothetical protein
MKQCGINVLLKNPKNISPFKIFGVAELGM